MTISKEAQEQSNLWEVDTLATTLHIAKQFVGEALKLVSRVERNGAWCLCLGLELGLELGLGVLTVRTEDTIVPAGKSISLVNLTVKKRPILQ